LTRGAPAITRSTTSPHSRTCVCAAATSACARPWEPQELGIPTANVASDALRTALAEAVTGIYGGWASVGADATPHPMVMSIGEI